MHPSHVHETCDLASIASCDACKRGPSRKEKYDIASQKVVACLEDIVPKIDPFTILRAINDIQMQSRFGKG